MAEGNTLLMGGVTELMRLSAMTDSAKLEIQVSRDQEYINDQDNEGWTALHYAAAHGLVINIALLGKAGANPHIKNKDGKTPADIAFDAGHFEAAALLREMEKALPLSQEEKQNERIAELEKKVAELEKALAALIKKDADKKSAPKNLSFPKNGQ